MKTILTLLQASKDNYAAHLNALQQRLPNIPADDLMDLLDTHPYLTTDKIYEFFLADQQRVARPM